MRWRVSVEETLVEMYLAGVSVCCVKDITEILWGSMGSFSTISGQNQKIYKNIEEWRNHLSINISSGR